MPLILLTNDDGIEADGLKCLEEALKGLAEIVVVAPDRERSAVSHGLTIDKNLTLGTLLPNRYVLDGTPADCVIYALKRVVKALPDLVVSGINHGANLAEDIFYSGTVAAAREASKHGIPSFAVSQAFDEKPLRFKEGARFVRRLVQSMLQQKPGDPVCLNINLPFRRIKGVRVTRQGCLTNFSHFNRMGTRNGDCIGTQRGEPSEASEMMLDFQAIEAGFVSITPLQRDQTDYAAAQSLAREVPRLFRGFGLLGFGLNG